MYERPIARPRAKRLRALRASVAVAGIFFVGIGALDILYRLSGAPGIVAANNGPAASAASLSRPQNREAAAPRSAPFIPVRLIVPVIGVDAKVEQAGLNPDGAMQAPTSVSTVAWYKGGPRPGESGNAVIAGHLNTALGLSGVFERLGDLRVGDTVIVEGQSGHARYIVRALTVYDAATAPAERIFAVEGPSTLVLITCNGAWDHGARSYEKRLVVVAEMI